MPSRATQRRSTTPNATFGSHLASGGSGCADGFPVGVPFALQWPPMAVWVHHIHCFRRGEEPSHKTTDDGVIGRMEI